MRSPRARGAKDPAYLRFVRKQECCVPTCTSKNLHKWSQAGSRTEAHHAGNHGLSQLADDRTAIPLCKWHHTLGPDAIHRMGRTFWEHFGIDKERIIAELNAKYEEEACLQPK